MIPGEFAKALLGVSALAGLAVPAGADERLVERVFNERDVIRVEGRLHVQATIIFGENETIENVAVGDAQTWQITPNKRANLLFVKPLAAAARTNMTVITDQHRYFFDLIASKAARPMYMLRFVYNDTRGRPATGGLHAERTRGASPAGNGAATPHPAAPVTAAASDLAANPATLNFGWKTSGDSRLIPQRIYDDGSATFLQLRESQPVPAILLTNDKGDEGPVNYTVRGDTIVIAEVPRTLILRNGKARAILRHEARERAPNPGLRGAAPRQPALGANAAAPAASTLSSPGMAGR